MLLNFKITTTKKLQLIDGFSVICNYLYVFLYETFESMVFYIPQTVTIKTRF